MEDCPVTFERGHQPHENRFIKVPGAEAPGHWSPPRTHLPIALLSAAAGAGVLLGALLYAVLHGH